MSTCCVQSARLKTLCRSVALTLGNCATIEATVHTARRKITRKLSEAWSIPARYSRRCAITKPIDRTICLLAPFNAVIIRDVVVARKQTLGHHCPRQKVSFLWKEQARMGEITFRTCDTLYTRANSGAMTQRRLCWAIRESRLAVILSSDLKWERFLQRVCFI